MQIIPHFFFVFPLPQPATPIFKEDPIASMRHPVGALRRPIALQGVLYPIPDSHLLASRLLSSLIAHLRWSSLLLATCLDIYLRCHHSLIRDVAVKIQRTSIAQGDMRSGGNILRSALRSIATNKIYKISARSARSYILITSRLSPYRL